MTLTDDWGRFEISEDLRGKLRGLWDSPDRAILEALRDLMLDFLYGQLRSCAKEDVDAARAQLDVIELFFALMERTGKDVEELTQDAGADDSYVSQTI